MYRIRFHGRGGQGVKTASRILGSAFFVEGYDVQDAPRYGAERRGAPLFATVRASRDSIRERGSIGRADLVVVVDDTLVPMPAAGVLAGIDAHTTLLLRSEEGADTWRQRLALEGPVHTLDTGAELRTAGARCAGAAARLLGVISRPALEDAIRKELATLSPRVVEESRTLALQAYDDLAEHQGCVCERPRSSATPPPRPHWIDLPAEGADLSAPDVHGALTSVKVRTGLWRTVRPVIDLDRCHRCHWVCGTQCPDGVIRVGRDGAPEIDYEHCKGCLVCVSVCPAHAISAVAESEARRREESAP